MGVKMSKARFDGRIVSLEEYRKSMKGQLRCIYCGNPITHVSGHTKSVGDREVWVKSYFRLLNKENPHNEGCEYITSNFVKKIFAKVSDTDLMTKKGDKYIARLHIVMEEVVEKDKWNGIKGGKKGRTDKKPTKKYIRNGEKPAYLQTMKKIVNLKERLDNDKELKDLVVLQIYNDFKKAYDEIKWKNFYVDYNVKQYEYIYKLLKNNKVYHPICFAGDIKEVKKIQDKDLYVIKYYSIKKAEGEYISLSIMTKSRDVYEYAEGLIDKKIVAYGCGHYIGNVNNTKKDGKDIKYYNFSTYVNVKEQLFVLE